ncbi:MAG: EAL domain-containing protein [Bauldia sp.]|nr:EAL domain-containing protein [Bauldia sp.]
MNSPRPLAGARQVRRATDGDTLGALRSLQHAMLESVATGRPLAEVMDLLCRSVEAIEPEVICSVLAVDRSSRLRHLSSPSLPQHYIEAIDGLPVGPMAGSCGTAAYLGHPVAVSDIAADPLWADYRQFALPIGLRACWSSPIKSSTGRVIGTLALYRRTTGAPEAFDHDIVESCLHHCAIAIEHEETRRRVSELAFRDALTGLHNRASFQAEAEQALRVVAAGVGAAAIHYIDLDDFKGVNDTLGHRVGDQLLEEAARRLIACAQYEEMVARLGGDEFAVIQPAVASRTEVDTLAARIVAAFEAPFDIEDNRIRIGASVGIAMAPADGCDLVAILRKADLALYEAKGEGRGRYRFFTPEIDAALQRRRVLEHDLRLATEARAFELRYQPIVHLHTGATVAVEALLRWNHPVRGVVSPTEFIAAAEDTGLIEEIGEWALVEACRAAVAWRSEVKVSVNLSCRQFRRAGLLQDIVRALERTGLPPHRLELEITESVILSKSPAVGRTLRDLRAMGVCIVLDDFGTGYSSLSYLRTFPFSKIKIDRSFIADLTSRPDCAAIVRAIIALARDLGIRTTAEGIETAEQLEILREEGCIEGQGYLFGRPMPAADVASLFGAGLSGAGLSGAGHRGAANDAPPRAAGAGSRGI